jgi:hypothetical protein
MGGLELREFLLQSVTETSGRGIPIFMVGQLVEIRSI